MDRRDFVKTSGWSVLGLAAAGSLLGCGSQDSKRIPAEARERFAKMRDLRIWWGDVHNHCNVTYGHGDLVDALAADTSLLRDLSKRKISHDEILIYLSLMIRQHLAVKIIEQGIL